jgi:uncharacterized oxidoreductase
MPGCTILLSSNEAARERHVPSPNPVIVEAARLEAIVHRIFQAAGSHDREAALVARHLVEANLRGHDSHGIGMIPAYIENALAGVMPLNRELAISRDTGPLLVCDAGIGLGQVMAHDAMVLGIERARQYGTCIVGLRNAHHIGRIGHWAEQCAAAGFVSIHFVNVASRPTVAPHGGTQARMGTNPLAIGIPHPRAEPVVVDFATSRWAVGKVRVAHNKGETLPPGILLDAEGRETTDPAQLFAEPAGALLTMGEHKGWGLSLACELLAGALLDAEPLAGERSSPAIINSMLTVIVDPHRLSTVGAFTSKLEQVVTWVQSETRDGHAVVRLPGEPERETRAARLSDGILIDPKTWQEVLDAAAKVGLSEPDLNTVP